MVNKTLLIFDTKENNLQTTGNKTRKNATSILSTVIKFEKKHSDTKLYTIWASKTKNTITRSEN